jgi:glutathione S-transferase/RNA polymerase-associated protein
MIVLFEHPASPYAQKIKILLIEKGLPFEARMPGVADLAPTSDFAKGSPRGEVPVLVDGETRVFDSTIIAEYLEDAYPEPAMRPKSASERARVRMLEETCDTLFEAVNWAVGEIVVWGRAEGALRDSLLARAVEQTAGIHRWLERELGARPFMNGESFGYGDACVYPYVAGAAGRACAPPPGSKLADWYARVLTRPSVARCVADVAPALGSFDQLKALLAQGLFKREYRDHRLEWMLRSGGIEIVLEGMKKNNIRFSHEPS